MMRRSFSLCGNEAAAVLYWYCQWVVLCARGLGLGLPARRGRAQGENKSSGSNDPKLCLRGLQFDVGKAGSRQEVLASLTFDSLTAVSRR